uniref:Uncharacterized protein n=1 Tax=Anguilla anguilla TaxID=7936 RepID=A0A0E9SSX8_ANGAN
MRSVQYEFQQTVQLWIVRPEQGRALQCSHFRSDRS